MADGRIVVMNDSHREMSRRSPTRLPISYSAFSAILLAIGALASCPGFASRAMANIGNRPAQQLGHGITAIGLASDPVTGAYWILKSNGGVASFRAPWRGSVVYKLPPGVSATAVASSGAGGYLILTSDGRVHDFGTPWYGSLTG